MIRATTGGVLRGYRYNLSNSFIKSNKARDMVLSQRNFNSYAEDPASAAKAFRLRKSRLTVQSQYNTCNSTYGKYSTGWDCLESISLMIDNDTGSYMSTIKGTTLSDLNDPEGSARTQLTKALDQISQTIVQTMNQKYGDNFIFAGADGHNVPFEIREGGKLYYRGVSVDAAEPNVARDTSGNMIRVINGQINLDDPTGTTAADGTTATSVNYLKMDKLTLMSKEDYDKLYTKPLVELDANDFCKRYSLVNGEYEAIPPMDPDQVPPGELPEGTPEDTTIYYQRMQDDGNGNLIAYDPPQFITTDQYNEELARYNDELPEHKSLLVGQKKDAGGNIVTEPVTVNAEGKIDPDGKYYLVLGGDYESTEDCLKNAVISQEEYNAQKLEADKLEYLKNEKLFLDIGLGFQENDEGQLIPSSAFNASVIAIDFIGSGLDEEGDPRNIYSIVQELKKIAESVPEGEEWDTPTWEKFDHLVGKLEEASSEFHTAYVNYDAGTTKLKNNVDLLKDNFYNLQEQYMELEDVDMADAITSFVWAQYAYNAALKVGNSILSQSLMDYLN